MNKVILIGNLVRDPEARQIPSGRLVTNFTVAVNDNIPNANANFIRCVAWNNQANFLTTYLKKVMLSQLKDVLFHEATLIIMVKQIM